MQKTEPTQVDNTGGAGCRWIGILAGLVLVICVAIATLQNQQNKPASTRTNIPSMNAAGTQLIPTQMSGGSMPGMNH